ncbi:hypothetical protein [Pedobacter agri]|uniref:hypothetical protein n=1 Tax=Pedobacter agri TaxID=454586 RepID=UPI00292FEB65|nr:hypothetical protein [Pedobacter agri]
MLIEPPDSMDEVMLTAKAFAESSPIIEKIFSEKSIIYKGYEKSFWGRKKLVSILEVVRIKDKKFVNYDSCDDNYFTVSIFKGDEKIKEEITNYKFANDAYRNLITDTYTSYGLGNPNVSKMLYLYGYILKDIEKLIKE